MSEGKTPKLTEQEISLVVMGRVCGGGKNGKWKSIGTNFKLINLRILIYCTMVGTKTMM